MDFNNKLPPPTRVKSKTSAPVQITAEQILREARDLQDVAQIRSPKQQINNAAELSDCQLQKRKEFEDQIRRRGREVVNVNVWVKYAEWEDSLKEFHRARSVWQRALEVDGNYRNPSLWVKYAEAEMKNKFINHARNAWEEAIKLLPRVDQLWQKYIHMEQMLGNVTGARNIYRRWMGWLPDHQAWLSFIKFEVKYHQVENARAVFEQFVQCHPKAQVWIRYAKFEAKNGEVARARNVYERAVETLQELADDNEEEQLEQSLVAFADFLEWCKEIERARSVYKLALDRIQRPMAKDLYDKFVAFEKRHGDRESIENAILGKRRFEYEDEVKRNPLNYDLWFDYIRLEEESAAANRDMIREVYLRAIANVPPAQEKQYWKRYIYLWINYALYEELEAEDMERTRQVYGQCLKLIPHSKFSFSKVWLLAVQFEIRQLNLKGARQILGSALGKAPKAKIFDNYIEMELQLKNVNRCRKLYEKYLAWSPQNCYAWIKYAELESILHENERVRALFEVAIGQPQLDKPELLWKAYLDFEISEGEFERARQLYERLLDRTQHLQVWISYAKFEAEDQAKDSDSLVAQGKEKQCIRIKRARRVFERADEYLDKNKLKEERSMLLEEWLKMEANFGDVGDVSLVRAKLPMKVKRKRPIVTEDGGPAGFEEYIDYLFPEETQTRNIKILEAAYRWKRQKVC